MAWLVSRNMASTVQRIETVVYSDKKLYLRLGQTKCPRDPSEYPHYCYCISMLL